MNRPWQSWLLFGLGLSIVLSTFGWLTVKVLELDQSERLVRRQAAREDNISRALWRMDSSLTPLLAEEAARPEYLYRSVYVTTELGKGGKVPNRSVSPLLLQPPAFALLHFELKPDGSLASPQCPQESDREFAISQGADPKLIERSQQRLQEITAFLNYQEVLQQLPLPVQSGSPGNAPSIPGGGGSLSQNAPGGLPPAQQQFGLGSAGGPKSMQQSIAQVLRPEAQQTDNDLQSRNAAYQSFEQKAVAEQRSQQALVLQRPLAVEGITRPLWLAGNLLLARRVLVGGQTVIQGCWLDWGALQLELSELVRDLLPDPQFVPMIDPAPDQQRHLLATLPVQVDSPLLQQVSTTWSPIEISLAAAWICLLIAAFAAAVTLHSIVALSERRAAFVSAVTHELRTPLTTFRMYAEMLAEGMLPSAEQRQRYLETLRVEADRLAHLIDNVLQFARLERGKNGTQREQVTLASLLSRVQNRLAERARISQMEFIIEPCDQAESLVLQTDVAAVEQILFNLVDNACKYAAAAEDRRIHVRQSITDSVICIRVCDHGPGISTHGRRKLFRPFSKSVDEAAHSAPGVGLGLALSRRLAADLGGRLELVAQNRPGAEFVLSLPIDATQQRSQDALRLNRLP